MSWLNLPDEMIIDSLLALYDQQSEYEKKLGRTIERNHTGFDALDAPVLTMYANTVLMNGTLSYMSIQTLKRRLWKYRKQLVHMGILVEEDIQLDDPPHQARLPI